MPALRRHWRRIHGAAPRAFRSALLGLAVMAPAGGCQLFAQRYVEPTEAPARVELAPAGGASGFITQVDGKQVDNILQLNRPTSVALTPGLHRVGICLWRAGTPWVRREVRVQVEPGSVSRIVAAVDYRRAVVLGEDARAMSTSEAGHLPGVPPADPDEANLRVVVDVPVEAYLRVDGRYATDAGENWLRPGEHFFSIPPGDRSVTTGFVDEGEELNTEEVIAFEEGMLYEITINGDAVRFLRIDTENQDDAFESPLESAGLEGEQ